MAYTRRRKSGTASRSRNGRSGYGARYRAAPRRRTAMRRRSAKRSRSSSGRAQTIRLVIEGVNSSDVARPMPLMSSGDTKAPKRAKF